MYRITGALNDSFPKSSTAALGRLETVADGSHVALGGRRMARFRQ